MCFFDRSGDPHDDKSAPYSEQLAVWRTTPFSYNESEYKTSI